MSVPSRARMRDSDNHGLRSFESSTNCEECQRPRGWPRTTATTSQPELAPVSSVTVTLALFDARGVSLQRC